MRIAVCDDDRTIIEQLETYFDSIEDKDLEYEVFFSAEELSRYISKEDDEFDLYILDIEMYEMSGLDLAKSIRQKNTNALVVFMTSHPKYVYDVFEVVTFDFIQKPFTYEKFEKVIHKVEKYLGIVKNKFIFEFQKNNFSIGFDKICRLEKYGRKLWIYTNDNKKYQCYMKIEDVWKQLNKSIFASLSQSIIVNLLEIEEITKEEVVLKDGTRLYVSRDYRKELKKKHLNYFRRVL